MTAVGVGAGGGYMGREYHKQSGRFGSIRCDLEGPEKKNRVRDAPLNLSCTVSEMKHREGRGCV